MGNSAMSVTGSPSGGSGTITGVVAQAPLSGGTYTTGIATIGVEDSGVVAGTYSHPTLTVTAKGLITAIESNTDQGPILGTYCNLKGSSAGTVKTATWTATQLVAWTTVSGVAYVGSSLSLSFNGATTGANGMDTGSFPVSGDLYIYAIYNPDTTTWATLATVAGSGSQVYGGVTLPSGYTASALIWSGKVYQSNLVAFFQTQNHIYWDANAVTNPATKPWSYLALTTSGSYASRSFATVVPVNAKSVKVFCAEFVSSQTATFPLAFSLASTVSGLGGQTAMFSPNGSRPPYIEIPFDTAQTLYFTCSEASPFAIRITGWTI